MDRMDKNIKEIYKEFFLNGVDNKDELLDGIIFFAHQDIAKDEIEKNTQNETTLSQVKEKAVKRCFQAHRFVDLNDRPGYLHYGIEKEDVIKKKIEEKVESRIKQLKEEKKIEIENGSINYNIRERFRFANYPGSSMTESKAKGGFFPYTIRHWTEDMSELLKSLENLEEENETKYYKLWLNTRIKRLENSMETRNRTRVNKCIRNR